MNEERKNQQAAAEPSLSEILQVRRDKLKALQDRKSTRLNSSH